MSVGSTIITGNHSASEGIPSLRNEAIMASAGSGKTYALSSRYLQLIFMGADPGSILASTFTRLAAGEIRDRILLRMAEAATDKKKCLELAKSIAPECASSSGSAENAQISLPDVTAALLHLVRNLHRLHIRTLDSFFGQVVRCFALELGLDPAAEVMDAELDRDMRREAIERMLDERDPQPLIDLLRVLTEGSAARNVTDAIDREMADLYELYREAPPHAWESIDFWKPLELEELQDAIARLSAAEPGDNGHHINAHCADCERARNARLNHAEDWMEFLCKGLPCAIEQKDGIFHRKPIADALIRLYQPLIHHAKAVVRNSIAARTISTHKLLDRFHHCYEEVKSANKAMTFADITARMADVFRPAGTETSMKSQSRASDICFRLDATLRHLLLDEMQDTSVQQWDALSEIVRSIISEPPPDRSFFCVGDVKQSIYGWREACPEVLAQMPALIESLGGDPQNFGRGKPLVQSWRSSPVVLHAVDRVLVDTKSNPALEGCADAAAAWDEAYLPHEAQFRDKAGYVELRIAPLAGEDDERQEIVRLQSAADLIAQLHHDAPNRRIGVLTRTNRTVNRFLFELGPARRNLDVAGRGGGSLTDSTAVNAILDLLRMMDHPDHTIAAFNVIHSPLGRAIGFAQLSGRQRIARRVRRSLLEDGYAKTIGHWIKQIGTHTDRRQLRRLIQLQQLAAQFDARPTLRADDFIKFAESSGGGSDPGAAAVHVMTVHQSKGLEFDIVVLADLDQDVVRTGGMKMVVERDSCGRIVRLARHVPQEVWSLFDDLEPMFAQQKMRMARESLCLLYVAMTRARYALHMIIDPPAENERKVRARLSGVVRCALAEEDVEPGAVVYHRGDERWFEKEPVEAEPLDDADAPQPIVLAKESGAIPRGRAAVRASALHGEPAGAVPEFSQSLYLSDQAARERGTAIHAMFEQVEWIEDFEPDTEQLVKLALSVAPRRGRAWAGELVDVFLRMLTNESVRHSLSRAGLDAHTVVQREVPFARLVNGEVSSGMIDRLVSCHDETGRCARAVVMDFKTDAVDSETAADRALRYRPQLESYRSAAASMLSIDESLIEMQILFVGCGVLIPLPAHYGA